MNMPLDASSDQSNCPPGYYRRDNGMVVQMTQHHSADDSRITEAELEKLGEYSREQLIALVRRISGAMGHICMMTDEETAQAMLDILAETALKPVLYGTSMKADITSRLTAVERWLDRKKGKPVGSSPTIQLGASGDLNVMIRLVDSSGNVEMIEG